MWNFAAKVRRFHNRDIKKSCIPSQKWYNVTYLIENARYLLVSFIKQIIRWYRYYGFAISLINDLIPPLRYKKESIWRNIYTENRQIITVITFSGGIYIFNSARLLINYYSNCTFPLNEIWLSVLIRLLRLPYFFCHKVSWNIG